MTSLELLELMGSARDLYILEAHEEEIKQKKRISVKRAVLIAAVIALSLLLVGCGIAYAQGWFANYFSSQGGAPLSKGQIEYISDNEQIICESQTQNEWTVELRSAIHDSTTAYIILGITAPADVNLEPEVVDGSIMETFSPGNGGKFGWRLGVPEVVTPPPRVVWSSMQCSWEEDGDGLSNTKNYVIRIHLDEKRSTKDPFGPEAAYKIHIDNIVRSYRDQEYLQELMDGKYKGQTDVMFTDEEVEKLHCVEILSEGVWDFTINFAEHSEGVELISEPVFTKADVYRQNEEDMFDVRHTYEDVKVTSFVLNPLSAVITYESDGDARFSDWQENRIYAVMKDGARVELKEGLSDPLLNGGYNTLDAESPIIVEEVDHILMADGTKIPMP